LELEEIKLISDISLGYIQILKEILNQILTYSLFLS